ncbi:hypothetical protein [Gimesia panareensis]|uniref:hypothetical protein n=1 Tax=Gimesia panareensis TaxID=2527978 RepID=UPI00118A95AB|nr:hypothetical protein [Gimesia panareensis]QDU50792.1 hypothetical protein Pan110_31520 [Gimesia panareensis]
MKELLTTVSSLLVILFSLSVLFLAEESETIPDAPSEQITSLSSRPPQKKTVIFNRVQGVKVKHGILIFITLEKEGLKDHYFSLRGKNVFLSQAPTSVMPINSIQFEEEGENSLRITFSPNLDIDLMEELTAI